MERYKDYLIYQICYTIKLTLEEVEESIRYDPDFTINRNEEGKMHSRYLGDRYEPAIIKCSGIYTTNYYLFDGDIKDCIHPYLITYNKGKIDDVIYYSSERIKNGEPIYMTNLYSCYNICVGKTILDEYESKYVYKTNDFKDFTLLCDEIDLPFVFKFAD